MTSHSPPADPEYKSTAKIPSPVSPKPLHYPTPANIPVLQNQIDQSFNQTSAHMATADALQQSLPPDFDQTVAGPIKGIAISDSTLPDTDAAGSLDGGEGHGAGTVQSDDSGLNNESAITAQAQSHFTDPMDIDPEVKASNDPFVPQATSAAASDAAATTADTIPSIAEPDVTSHNHDASQVPKLPAQTDDVTQSQKPHESGGLDYQKLLDSLSPSSLPTTSHGENPVVPSSAATGGPTAQPHVSETEQRVPAASDAVPTGLPPRPPPQAQPSIHPNYTQSSDIRSYHPHAQNPAVAQTRPNAATSSASGQAYPGAPHPPGVIGANAALPPPPVASFQAVPGQAQSPTSAQALQQHHQMLESAREMKLAAGESLTDDDTPWTTETTRQYEQFLEDERHFVQEGNWESFPYGSRLFVGNLSSERVTKRDIFHVFHVYGKLAQISIKQAYGFVQFFDAPSCDGAMRAEQGRTIRGKKISRSTQTMALPMLLC